MKAMNEAEAVWQKAMDKIAERANPIRGDKSFAAEWYWLETVVLVVKSRAGPIANQS